MADAPFAAATEHHEAYIPLRYDPERVRRNLAIINSIRRDENDG